MLIIDTYFLQAVQPSIGDVIYDEFEDGPGFTELETHFEHITPEELLLPESVSESTNTFIKEYVTRLQRSVYFILYVFYSFIFSFLCKIELR